MGPDGTLSIPLFIAHATQRSDADQARLLHAFHQNYAGVSRFLRRMGVAADRADDVAQQVFLVALEALDHIHEGSERAFLYGTAFRLAHGVRRQSEREIPSVDLESDLSPIPTPEQLTDEKMAREVIDAFILSLDVDIRTVFVLTEFEGFTTPEIAQMLEVPVGTAASRLRRAREKFQSMVRDTYGGSR